MNIIIFLAMAAVLTIAVPADAEIYKYTDKNGTVVFTDNLGNVPENQRSNAQRYEPQRVNDNNSTESLDNNTSFDEEQARQKLMEMLKEKYGARESCPKEAMADIHGAIKATWAKMSGALVSGDIETALTYFSAHARDKNRQRLSSISKELLSEIFRNYKSIELAHVYDNRYAECDLIREEKTKTYSYPAHFAKDADCVWRISGF